MSLVTRVTLALLLMMGVAQAETLYSAMFYGDSDPARIDPTCDTVPQECNVALNGKEAMPILVNPWEPVSINIVCVQVVFSPSGKIAPGAFIMAGSNYTPDPLIAMTSRPEGADERMCYPPGMSFPFPAKPAVIHPNRPGQNDFWLPHLDVHIQGRAWDNGPPIPYQVRLFVWYTKNPS